MKLQRRRIGEACELDDAARASAEGAFIRLRHGYTHMDLKRWDGSQPILLVHGFSVPYFIWDETFERLAAAGKTVLRYDLYGRGYSDRPRLAYNVELFVQQIEDLLEATELGRVDIIGLSMGGPISAEFARLHPHQIRKLVLIDPSGTTTIPMGALYRLAVLPGVGEVILSLVGVDYMIKKAADDFFDASLVEAFRHRYAAQMRYRGFQRAILSTLRNNMLGDFSSSYACIGRSGLPVLIIWGTEDRTVPFAQSHRLLELIPQAEFLPVAGVGHLPHYERPEVVHPRILDFLR